MRYDVLIAIILLIILVSIQITLNKILLELRIIKSRIEEKYFDQERDRN